MPTTLVSSFRDCLRAYTLDHRRSGPGVRFPRRLVRSPRVFVGAGSIRDRPALRDGFRGFRPRPRQCFRNAQLFFLNDAGDHADYYEGYVTSAVGLVLHAWLVAGGVVYDPTLEAVARAGIGVEPAGGRLYFGVPFTRKEVCLSMLLSGEHGPLLGNVPSLI